MLLPTVPLTIRICIWGCSPFMLAASVLSMLLPQNTQMFVIALAALSESHTKPFPFLLESIRAGTFISTPNISLIRLLALGLSSFSSLAIATLRSKRESKATILCPFFAIYSSSSLCEGAVRLTTICGRAYTLVRHFISTLLYI